MISKNFSVALSLCLCFSLILCNNKHLKAQTTDSSIVTGSHTPDLDSLLEYAQQFLGLSYGNRGRDTSSFDCSGYVRHIYGHYGIDLPHGSGAQAGVCKKIKLQEVRPGDLLFFSGRKVSRKNIGHVAMVLSTDDDRITMIHSTVHAGVIKEILQQSDYFTRRFIMAGRLMINGPGTR